MTGWLAEIPNSWSRYPAWAIFAERAERSSPGDEHLTPSQTYGVLPQEQYMAITGSRVVLNLTGADNMKAVREGDFIIHLRSFQGGIERSGLHGKVSNAYTVLQPALPFVDGYFTHLLKASVFIEQLVNLTDQLRDGQSINYARFSRMTLPMPPAATQQRIADFLDEETAQIDAMLGDLDRLESDLVTRDEHLSQFLIDQPGFALSRLAYVADITLGKMLDQKKYFGEPTPYIRAANVGKSGVLQMNDIKQMPMTRAERARLDLRAGDTVMIEGGDAGRVAYLSEDLDGFSFQKTVLRIRPRRDSVDPQYLFLALRQAHRSGRIALDHSVSTIPHFTAEKAERLAVPIPPRREQQRIVSELNEETARIDDMIADAQRLKALLAERRSTLINDVVTGRKEVA